jgi:hypothetical protein
LIPHKVSVITFGRESLLCKFWNPPLTTVAMNVGKYAHEAIQLVQALFRIIPTRPVQPRAQADLIVRESPSPAEVARVSSRPPPPGWMDACEPERVEIITPCLKFFFARI